MPKNDRLAEHDIRSDVKIIGPTDDVVFPRLSGQQISAEMSKINGWANPGHIWVPCLGVV